MAENQNDVNDDDEVVAEIDAFLTNCPEHNNLHVLQYPLRHANVGIGTDRRVTGVNIRPRKGRIEMNLSVLPDDPATAGDDFGCAQPSARSFDAAQSDAQEKAIGQIQCLRSRTNEEQKKCNYAAAMLVPRNDPNTGCTKYHFVLVPINAVSQLRPAFDYLDEHDLSLFRQRAQEKIMRMNARGETIPGAQDGASDEVAPLSVNFRRRESERAAEKRRNSHAYLREIEEGEPWIGLQYSSATSDESKNRRTQLFSAPVEETVTKPEKFEGDPHYKDLFLAHTKGTRLDITAKSTLNAEATSTRALKTLATNAAVQQVLAKARIASYAEIVFLIGERPAKEVLTAIRLAAFCLRGCWVAKKGVKDMRRQLSANERYDACRILILDIFRRTRVVTTKMAENAIGDCLAISEATVISVLSEVGEQRPGIGWELKIEDDKQFVLAHAALFRSQEAEWDDRVAKARETVDKSMRKGKTRFGVS